MSDTIAVLGMGLLGRGFAENLMAKGNRVRVWNRTAARCEPVVALGATACATPEEAVRGAVRVHLVLSEDASVDAVIEALRPGLGADVYVVDHTTNLPAGVAKRFARLRAERIRYVHAPVFMGPANSRNATGLMMISVSPEDEAALRPALEQMTGKVLSFGSEPDKAAKLKLSGNAMLFVITAGMGDLFAMGRAAGVGRDELIALFDQFAPTAAGMGRRALGTTTGAPVGFELTMARKDARLMLETAGDAKLALLPAIARAMDDAIAAGRGADDFTVIAVPKT